MATTVTSKQWREWVQANDSDDPLVILVEISYPGMSTIRVSSDPTKFIQYHADTQEPIYGTVSGGQTYYALPFGFTLPDDPDDGSVPRASISIDNVSRDYIEAVRNMQQAPTVNIKMVFASNPNTVQKQLPTMLLTDITMDASKIVGNLEPNDFRAQPFPSLNFYPSSFPGLFK